MLYQVVTSCPILNSKLHQMGIVFAPAKLGSFWEKRGSKCSLQAAQQFRDAMIKKNPEFVKLRIEYAEQ
jgi:hypothetical protein